MEEFGTAFGRMLSVVDRLANPVEVALFVPADSDPIPLLTAVHEHPTRWRDSRNNIRSRRAR